MTTDELRKKLGLKPTELLTNHAGMTADLLEVKGDIAVLGVLDTGRIIEVPISQLVRTRSEAKTIDKKLRKK